MANQLSGHKRKTPEAICDRLVALALDDCDRNTKAKCETLSIYDQFHWDMTVLQTNYNPFSIHVVLRNFMRFQPSSDTKEMCKIIVEYAYRSFGDEWAAPAYIECERRVDHGCNSGVPIVEYVYRWLGYEGAAPTYIECRSCVDLGCKSGVPWTTCVLHGCYSYNEQKHEQIVARLAAGKKLMPSGEEVPVPYIQCDTGEATKTIDTEPCFSDECSVCHREFCLVHTEHEGDHDTCKYKVGSSACVLCDSASCTTCAVGHMKQCMAVIPQSGSGICEHCNHSYLAVRCVACAFSACWECLSMHVVHTGHRFDDEDTDVDEEA